MERKDLTKDITVVGSGASLAAGTVTALTSIAAGIFGIALAPPVLPLAGLGGFLVGAVGTYFFEDKILKRAEKDAKIIEREGHSY